MLGVRLGLRDLVHERALFVTLATALATILAPILVIYALKTGVIEALTAELRSDPANLAIILRGDQPISEEEIKLITGLPETGFAVPAHRALSARTLLTPADRPEARRERAILLPSGPGDPALGPGGVAPGAGELVISVDLAESLAVGAGDRVTAYNGRSGAHAGEVWNREMRVLAVAPPDRLGGAHVLMSPEDVSAVEAFLEGFQPPDGAAPGRPLSERVDGFENMRLYAADLDSVAPLAARMEALGFSVISQAHRVAQIQRLEASFDALFLVLAGAMAAGGLVTVAALLLGAARRKLRALSAVRLLGASGLDLAGFAVAQGLAAAAAGFVLACLVAAAAVFGINAMFQITEAGGPALLRWTDLAAAGCLTAFAAALASIAGARTAMRADPSEALAHDR